MSTTAPAPRRSPFARRKPEDGPRASVRDLLPYLREHRGILIVVVVLSIAGAATSIAVPLLSRVVISEVQSGGLVGSVIAAIIAVVVVSGIISAVQHYLLQRTGTSIVLSARRSLVSRMLHLPIREFDLRRTGDLVSRVGSDTTLLYAVMTQGLVDALGSSLLFIGAIIAMLVLDPILFGCTILVLAVSVIAAVVLSRGVRRASAEQQRKVGDLASAVERSIGAIRTVRASGATEREVAAIEKEAVGAYDAGVKVARASALIVPIAGIALQASLLVVLGVGGYQVAAGTLPIANLITFIMFLFLLLAPLGQIFGALNSVNQALGAVGRIQEVIALPSEVEEDVNVTAAAAVESDAAISFESVKFSYPEKTFKTEAEKLLASAGLEGEHDLTVLRGVSFSVPRGSRTALVGPSGAGKSTILALIERFYDPTAGVVRFGGVDIRGLSRENLRGQIGYVEQDAPVLAGTIRQNLLLGAPNATEQECLDVIAAVNLGRVLERDPAGLDAQVGENGIMLSGGERQRLAIARTLLAAPPILLLDESTSSLDGLNEQLLREAIDAVATDRTLIVIAHRLSTVVDSDQIVVLDRGQVVGIGTHSELVKSTPLYADLAKHQLLV